MAGWFWYPISVAGLLAYMPFSTTQPSPDCTRARRPACASDACYTNLRLMN
jgi:hypothetical protein